MTAERVCNPHRSTSYYDTAKGCLRNDIWDLLTINRLREANYSAHASNISHFIARPDRHAQILAGIIAIPPRSIWLRHGDKWSVALASDCKPVKKATLEGITKTASRLLHVLDKKALAVELSGGLDTSIIIGLLNDMGLNPLLVGFSSDKFEFRTEKVIQDKYASCTEAVLLPQDESLPFSGLLDCPSHQLPSSTSLFYTHALSVAKVCVSKNIRILLSGMGFDSLLCDAIPDTLTKECADLWSPWTLDDNWFNEYVYSRHNIVYKSGAASRYLMRIVTSLRSGKGEDTQKRMTRKIFERYLPVELVRYAYKADNCTGFIEGFLQNETLVRTVFREARKITRRAEFDSNVADTLLQNIHKNEDAIMKSVLSRVSFATWLYCLNRDGKIG